ncbi:MAG: hypothetical protein A3H35_05715 [Betaproteobacteria bacterium RIFCSPLOWO2_02_FULL_62_17]|nr:MAG: hypothetical protein A3H35_05715 [Betaproteobacteria bacterium RIFCSPLOWO2_02_FULL_62_17]
MMKRMLRYLQVLACFQFIAVALAVPIAALAQAWPAKPVKYIMPFPPGGGSDISARIVAEAMSRSLGRPFLVENQAGANGNIGTQAAIRAAPDGYTLLYTPQTPITIAESYDPPPPFVAQRDLIPLVMTAVTPELVVVHPSIKAGSLKELAAMTRANPGKYFFGSPGEGHEFHLTAAVILLASGAQMTHVPYKGMGPVVQGIVGEQIHLAVSSVAGVKQFIGQGRLRPLAAVGMTRLEGYPNVPSLADNGLKEVTVYGWFGVFAPAGMPRELVDRIAGAHINLRNDAAYMQKLRELDFDPTPLGPAEFAREIEAHRAQWKTVIKATRK